MVNFQDCNPRQSLSVGPELRTISFGFLRHHSTYETQLSVSLEDDDDVGGITVSPASHVVVTPVTTEQPLQGGSESESQQPRCMLLKLQLYASKPGPFRDSFTISFAATHRVVSVAVQAKVMAKTQGTPMLKAGVHCIQVGKEEDSEEETDWKGFE